MDSNAYDNQEAENIEREIDYSVFEEDEAAIASGGTSRRRTEKRKAENRKAEINKAVGAEVFEWVQCLVAAILFCVITFSFFFRIIGIVGDSMKPNFHNGDRVLVTSVNYTLERGDIVVLRKDTFQEEPIIKRVIALAGQTVEIDFEEGIVYVDGVALTEPYIAEPTTNRLDFPGKVTVPENCVFVLGDNRNHSADSRASNIGCIDVRYIIGKVILRVMPVKDFGLIK